MSDPHKYNDHVIGWTDDPEVDGEHKKIAHMCSAYIRALESALAWSGTDSGALERIQRAYGVSPRVPSLTEDAQQVAEEIDQVVQQEHGVHVENSVRTHLGIPELKIDPEDVEKARALLDEAMSKVIGGVLYATCTCDDPDFTGFVMCYIHQITGFKQEDGTILQLVTPWDVSDDTIKEDKEGIVKTVSEPNSKIIVCGNTCTHNHNAVNGPTGCCPKHGEYMYYCYDCRMEYKFRRALILYRNGGAAPFYKIEAQAYEDGSWTVRDIDPYTRTGLFTNGNVFVRWIDIQ